MSKKRDLRRRSKDGSQVFGSIYDVVEHYGGNRTLGEVHPHLAKGEDPEGHDSPEAPAIDWQHVALELMREYIPALKIGKPAGRPSAKDPFALYRAVQELLESGEAKSASHACTKRVIQEQFPDRGDLYSAYKRQKTKIKKRK